MNTTHDLQNSHSQFPKGIVLLATTMSLDGFIAGPNDDMDWIFNYRYSDNIVKQLIDSTGPWW